MRSLLFLITLVVLVLLSACADEPSAPAPLPQGVTVPAVSRADVLALLANANAVQVPVTESDLEQMAQNSLGHNGVNSLSDALGSIRQQVAHCNTTGYVLQFADDDSGPTQIEESVCYGLGHQLAPQLANGQQLNVDLTAAEVAFARACVAPKANGIPTSGCVDLGQLYEYEGKPELALAVYQNAAKCQGALMAQSDVLAIDPDQQEDWSNLQRKNCLKQEVAILAKMHLYAAEREVATTLCNAASEMGCGYLKSLGTDVDMQAVEQRQAELQAANQATAAADQAADARSRAEHDANFAAKVQALQGAAGSDPNAIVDTANQAAANMTAIGEANDAARQARYREQLEAQRREREEASAAQESSQATGTRGQNESESSASSAGRTGNVGGGLSSPNGSTAAGGGGGTNGGSYGYMARCQTSGCVPALPASCVTQFNDPKYYNWISLRDNCGQAIDVQFSRIGIGGAGQGDVAPGASVNTGFADSEAPNGLTIAVCPAAYVAWSTQTDDIWMGSGGFVCLRKP